MAIKAKQAMSRNDILNDIFDYEGDVQVIYDRPGSWQFTECLRYSGNPYRAYRNKKAPTYAARAYLVFLSLSCKSMLE